MEFNPTTFAFEAINFLVLVWILQHFLYKPVMGSLAQRKSAIEASIEEARTRERAAADLQRQYEERMSGWMAEREEARSRLGDEIAAERARLLTDLHSAIEAERERNRGLEDRRALELRLELERQARASGARFASRLLSRLAGPELEDRIGQVVAEDLLHLPLEQANALRDTANADGAVHITSAYPLAAEARRSLAQALELAIGRVVTCEFARDAELIAGFRITAGTWVLRCNVADELVEFARHNVN